MLNALGALLPVFAGFGVGFVLRRLGLATRAEGDFIFRLLFYVCSPALIFVALVRAEVSLQLLIFPLFGLLAVTSGYVVGRLLRRGDAVLLMACMIVNSGFSLPFVQALYGAEGLARLAAFDAVAAALVFTWVYSIAAKANPKHSGGAVLVGRFLRSPPLYAMAAGVIVSLIGVTLPTAVMSTLAYIGAPTGFLITVAIGLLFNPKIGHLRSAALALSVRMGTAVLLVSAIVAIAPTNDVDLGVLMLLAVAPLGFNLVTFASLENLDSEKAAGMLSLSLVVSCVLSTVVVVSLA